jgi:hypothetical protein
VENILRSLQSVSPSHLLDRELFDFGAIEPTDKALDIND